MSTKLAKASERARKYQLKQNSRGFCGIHPNVPLARTSTSVCQACLDKGREAYAAKVPGAKRHKSIWQKIEDGAPTTLSTRDIEVLRDALAGHPKLT